MKTSSGGNPWLVVGCVVSDHGWRWAVWRLHVVSRIMGGGGLCGVGMEVVGSCEGNGIPSTRVSMERSCIVVLLFISGIGGV